MRPLPALPLAALLVALSAAAAADPAADILGRWELKEAAAGLPAGTSFDFQKAGKLVVAVDLKGAKKSFDFKYELTGKVLKIVPPGGKGDTTEIVTLDKTDLVVKDKDGTTAGFKRVK